jgi:hypothetical protein
MYGIKTRGLPGTLAPMYQELQVERSEVLALRGHATPSFPRPQRLRLDSAEPLFAQMPDTIGSGEVVVWEVNGTNVIGGGSIANPGPT